MLLLLGVSGMHNLPLQQLLLKYGKLLPVVPPLPSPSTWWTVTSPMLYFIPGLPPFLHNASDQKPAVGKEARHLSGGKMCVFFRSFLILQESMEVQDRYPATPT